MSRVEALGGRNFIWVALVTALISATSTMFCIKILGVAPWLMFLGWSTYVTGNGSVKAGWSAGACAMLGSPLAVIGLSYVSWAQPQIGDISIFIQVLVLTAFAVLSTLVPPLNSPVGWFLGLLGFIGYVGSGRPVAFSTVPEVVIPVFVGLLSGTLASFLATKIQAIGAPRPVVHEGEPATSLEPSTTSA